MFGEVAEEGEGMVLGRSEEIWLTKGLLASAKFAKETFVGGKSGVEMCSMFCELLSFCFEFEVV